MLTILWVLLCASLMFINFQLRILIDADKLWMLAKMYLSVASIRRFVGQCVWSGRHRCFRNQSNTLLAFFSYILSRQSAYGWLETDSGDGRGGCPHYESTAVDVQVQVQGEEENVIDFGENVGKLAGRREPVAWSVGSCCG